METLYKLLKLSELDPTRTYESNFIAPHQLLGIRIGSLIFCLSSILLKIIDPFPVAIDYVMFLTNLMFYSITGYMIASTYFSWRYYLNSKFVPWFNLHWGFKLPYFVLYQMNNIVSFIVSLVYWSLLAKDDFNQGHSSLTLYLSVAMHAGNIIMVVTEMIFSRNMVILWHLPIIFSIVMLYIPYTIILNHIYNRWPYEFLNFHQSPGTFTIILLGITITAIILHYLFHFLHQLRDRYYLPPSLTLKHIITIKH